MLRTGHDVFLCISAVMCLQRMAGVEASSVDVRLVFTETTLSGNIE